MTRPRTTRIMTDFSPNNPPKLPVCDEHDMLWSKCRRCGRTEQQIEAINVQARLEEDRKPRKQPVEKPVRKKASVPSPRTRRVRGNPDSGSSL